ncbi:hypothetical protein, partial [Nonomuraea rubra]|uniref:hypothetical protein n=1 Tax=Nonomuraea rubra TaxID=46180 RepID=UPI0031F1A5E3
MARSRSRLLRPARLERPLAIAAVAVLTVCSPRSGACRTLGGPGARIIVAFVLAVLRRRDPGTG